MSTTLRLTGDDAGISVEHKLYSNMIDSLLYIIASGRDISFIIDVYAQFQTNPKVSHLNDVKRIIKYISGTC